MPAMRPQADVRIERGLGGETLRIRGFDGRPRRQHIGPPREQVDGQLARHRERRLYIEHGTLDRRVGVGALTRQGGELVDGKICGGPCLLIRDACLRQLAFGFADLELCIESGAHAATRDVEDVLALRLGALRDVREGVLAIELDVRLRDGAGEHEARIILIEARGLRQVLCAVQGVRLTSPEIEVPAQAGAGLAHPEGMTGERRRNDVVLRRALVQGARIEVGVRQERGACGLRLRKRRAHPRLRLGQGRAVLEPLADQPIELRIIEGIPPVLGRRLDRRAGEPDILIDELPRMGIFLRRSDTSGEEERGEEERGFETHVDPHAFPARGRHLDIERRLEPGIEFDEEPLELRYLVAREIGERAIELVDNQRNEAFDRLTARGGELQLHLAAVAIAAHALEQAALFQLIDDPGEGAAVVAVLRADVLRIHCDAVPYPGEDHVMDEAEAALREHILEHVHHHRLRALDEVADAGLRLVRRWVIMLLRHLVPRQLLLKQSLPRQRLSMPSHRCQAPGRWPQAESNDMN